MPLTTPAREIHQELASWPIYDPHSHIDARRPAARNLDEVLGYHYYTELCHSAGMPAALVAPELAPRERVANLAGWLERIGNTVQFSWLEEIARTFHGHEGPIGPETIEGLYDRSLKGEEEGPAWDEEVWSKTGLECVFLTNEFDDPLDGFDPTRYVPCLRTDDLVLKLHEPRTVERLRAATATDVGDLASFREALGKLFGRFVARGARACAISLPPDFVPEPTGPVSAATPVRRTLRGLETRPDEREVARRAAFWTIAEMCADHKLPFDLMIGPVRDAYPAGVAGGRDLFDRRVSLADYRKLFNHFPEVKFPVSVLSPDASGELVAYSWVFPNVVPMGHWWYSNLPAFIKGDLKARLEGLPGTKPVGYYSDAYKLEFVLPKFNMYRRVLAESLGEVLVSGRGWSVERALGVARRFMLENPRDLFRRPGERSTSA